jgi:hypothetical protein
MQVILCVICGKIFNLKFDTLLAQYLYQHKKLNLPGIGIFEASGSLSMQEDSEKQKTPLEGISYKNIPVQRADDELIEFIKLHTGKMKPLAMSDLESYLALGKQFLNIGKPFYIEGIGTLSLSKQGKLDFTPGAYVSTKLEDPNLDRSENKASSIYEEDRVKHESTNNNIKRIILILGTLATLFLIGWAGYYLYTINANNENAIPLQDQTQNEQNLLKDSLNRAAADSLQKQANDSAAAASASPGQYKFIIEKTNNKARALRRYRNLHDNGSKIQIQSPDSVNFILYYSLPAMAKDTARIKDSLNRWHFADYRKMRVTIEQ